MLIMAVGMVARFIPLLRRNLWRRWYTRMGREIVDSRWTFLNYGVALPAKQQPELSEVDEPNRNCIQMYHFAIAGIDLAGRDVLEVGSGRGGGARFVAEFHRPKSMCGLDVAAENTALARKLHCEVGNLKFKSGDAERSPFSEESFDALLNIESSHCYPKPRRFFAEAARVLRPGGHFLFADLRAVSKLAELRRDLDAIQSWRLLEEQDITPLVLEALNQDSSRKRQLIAETAPSHLRSTVGGFAALVGSPMYSELQSGKKRYLRIICQKATRGQRPLVAGS